MIKIHSFLIIVFFGALLFVSDLLAQDEQTTKRHNLKFAFELGTNVTDGNFFNDNEVLNTTYLGIKPEFFILNNRVGIASGLRFFISTSKLVSNGDNLSWIITNDGFNMKYLHINDIRHNSYLVGIPLEIRFFPNKRELPFQHYFKFGASFNYPFYAKNKVNIKNGTSAEYDDIIQHLLPKDNDALVSFIFGALGFKIGKYKEGKYIPWGNIEFQFPNLLLKSQSSSSIEDNLFLGVGFQVSFQIPIGINVPIGSN